MDLSQTRFDRLVDLIYATLEDRNAWREFLECLNDAVGTRAVHLLAFDGSNGALSYSEGADMAPQIDMEYIQKFQFIDPRVELLRNQKESEWLHCHEHFDDAFVATHPFYQDFLLPHGARYLSACPLVKDESATVLLACLNRPHDGPVPQAVIEFVERLRPHMSRACRVGISNFVYSTQALVGNALVNKLRQPVLLMTTDGQVIQVNDAADALLKSTTLARIDKGRLVLAPPYLRRLLEECAALEAQMREGARPDDAQLSAFRSLHIAGAGSSEVLYGFFTMLVPERVMGTFGLRPLVMLFLYHPESAQPIDTSLLTAAFGLSHAECRIATLLADGMPLKLIAETIGVQYDTVRKQLQSIYQKTSTNRQPELVRLLLHLPAAASQPDVVDA